MNGMGKCNEHYDLELSDRLNMKRALTSLTRLTKTDLDRVFQMGSPPYMSSDRRR
jgi:hypothetical protein